LITDANAGVFCGGITGIPDANAAQEKRILIGEGRGMTCP